MTEDEDAETDLDQQDGIDGGEMKDVDWKVKVALQNIPTRKEIRRSDTCAVERLVHTVLNGTEANSPSYRQEAE